MSDEFHVDVASQLSDRDQHDGEYDYDSDYDSDDEGRRGYDKRSDTGSVNDHQFYMEIDINKVEDHRKLGKDIYNSTFLGYPIWDDGRFLLWSQFKVSEIYKDAFKVISKRYCDLFYNDYPSPPYTEEDRYICCMIFNSCGIIGLLRDNGPVIRGQSIKSVDANIYTLARDIMESVTTTHKYDLWSDNYGDDSELGFGPFIYWTKFNIYNYLGITNLRLTDKKLEPLNLLEIEVNKLRDKAFPDHNKYPYTIIITSDGTIGILKNYDDVTIHWGTHLPS